MTKNGGAQVTARQHGIVMSAEFPQFYGVLSEPLMRELLLAVMRRFDGIQTTKGPLGEWNRFLVAPDVGAKVGADPIHWFEMRLEDAVALSGGLSHGGPEGMPVEDQEDLCIEVCAKVLAACEVRDDVLIDATMGKIDESGLAGASRREQVKFLLEKTGYMTKVLDIVEKAAADSVKRMDVLPDFDPADCDIDAWRDIPVP